MKSIVSVLILSLLYASSLVGQETEPDTSRGDAMIAEYFQQQTTQIENRFLAGIHSAEDWYAQREKHVTQLKEMLGLQPFPERTALKPVITGVTKHPEFRVENLHFQSRPGLYVTGNLYVPNDVDDRLPAILYVCGHGQVKIDGIAYGAKAHYQHHGAWFARNGYVCLTIDTLQLGEIEGIHHGTYRYDKWWWLNRGYTPAGVEAWNCIRALDYLQSREEVDGERLGVTGRSGGGAYSWWIAALDERIKVAVPVAGTTDLRNHVVDGTVEGHCDCMFMVNTYQWDYPMVAALMAPRPLLLSNTDNDRIFPLDGVYRTYNQVRQVYEMLGAGDKFSLHITSGPHKDTQELRVHAFRWFNYYLQDGKTDLLRTQADKLFEPQQLKVFETLPEDQKNTQISESFVPRAAAPAEITSQEQLTELTQSMKDTLLSKSFAAWPDRPIDLKVKRVSESYAEGLVMTCYTFQSQQAIELNLYILHDKTVEHPKEIVLHVLDQASWLEFLARNRDAFGDRDVLRDQSFPSVATRLPEPMSRDPFEKIRQDLLAQSRAYAYVAPRGVGPTLWDTSPKKQIQHQRRFYLLGQSLEAMQVWDVRRSIQAIAGIPGNQSSTLSLASQHRMAGVALYAALFQQEVKQLHLTGLSGSHDQGPFFLNISRYYDIPQVTLAVAGQSRLELDQVDSKAFNYTTASARHLNWAKPRLVIRDRNIDP